MALDPRYITAVDLGEVFLDTATGQPLAGGQIFFWQDAARTVPKLVYELSGSPPNYTYSPLPNPITLSLNGMIQDNAGNNVALYYFPYDANGNVQLYFIQVFNSQGTEQFTREAWPNIVAGANPNVAQANISNFVTNPQFAVINIDPIFGDTITVAGAGSYTVAIAPGWNLNFTTTGASTVMVIRNNIAGSSAYPFNPPYTLTVTPGPNISALNLTQQFQSNPDIWSPQAGGPNGFLNASILLAPLSSVIIYYAPSTGPQQQVLNANNTTGVYSQFSNTVQLAPATNPDTSALGYVNLVIALPIASVTTLSNIQITSLQSNIQNVVYDQTPISRQIDQSFNYFGPLLGLKPIPSYLIGWDFATNPTQPLGPSVAASASGANTSAFTWDQTILFQSVNNGIATTRGTNGCMTLTATNSSQFALVQYLPASVAREILNYPLSVNVAAYINFVNRLSGNVSLWYTTDANLPSIGSNNSLVATLGISGKPTTFNGNWTEVTRNNLGDANFTVASSVGTTGFNDYSFSFWNINNVAATNTATYMAIVIGFETLTAAQALNISSISLVPGNIATRPGPESPITTLEKCQAYYEKSFNQGVVPAQNIGAGVGETVYAQAQIAGTSTHWGTVFYKTTKRLTTALAITTFNPSNGNSQIRDFSANADCANTTVVANGQMSFTLACTTAAGSGIGDALGVNWVSDGRLGK